MPEEEVPLRSVTVASDGSMLVAANNKVGTLQNCYVARGLGGVNHWLFREIVMSGNYQKETSLQISSL